MPPAAEAVRRAWHAARSHPAHTVAALGAAAAIGITAVALPDGPRAAPPSATARPPSTAQPANEPISTQQRPSPVTVSPVTAPPSSTTTCPQPAPLDQLDPATAIGCPVAAATLTVAAVAADEGFRATTTAQQQVWVQLIGSGESPMSVQPGQQVTVTGTIRPPGAVPPESGMPSDGADGQPPYQLDVAFSELRPAN